MAEVGVVDAHVHLLPPRLAARVRRVFDAYLPGGLAYPTPDPHTVLADLEAAGVGTAWVLPYAHAPGVADWLIPATADHLAELSATHPSVDLVLAATVHPGDDDPAEIVRSAVADRGARALKLHRAVGGFDADDPRLDPVWGTCTELALPVVLHAGHHGAGVSAAEDLHQVDVVAARFPGLPLVVAHAALPAVDATLALLDRHPNLHADLTPVVAATPELSSAQLERYAGRLLFGSDAPNTGVRIPDLITRWRATGASDTALDAVLGGTARRLTAAVRP